jgi:hypothetical protein
MPASISHSDIFSKGSTGLTTKGLIFAAALEITLARDACLAGHEGRERKPLRSQRARTAGIELIGDNRDSLQTLNLTIPERKKSAAVSVPGGESGPFRRAKLGLNRQPPAIRA